MRSRIQELESAKLSTVTHSITRASTNTEDPVLRHGKQLDFKAEVVTSKGVIPTHIIMDSGATVISFVDTKFAK